MLSGLNCPLACTCKETKKPKYSCEKTNTIITIHTWLLKVVEAKCGRTRQSIDCIVFGMSSSIPPGPLMTNPMQTNSSSHILEATGLSSWRNKQQNILTNRLAGYSTQLATMLACAAHVCRCHSLCAGATASKLGVQKYWRNLKFGGRPNLASNGGTVIVRRGLTLPNYTAKKNHNRIEYVCYRSRFISDDRTVT